MSNDPEIYLEVVEDLGYDPTMIEPPHEHTIRIPGCVRCDLAAEEAKPAQKKAKPRSPRKNVKAKA